MTRETQKDLMSSLRRAIKAPVGIVVTLAVGEIPDLVLCQDIAPRPTPTSHNHARRQLPAIDSAIDLAVKASPTPRAATP
jgi:hypothetical protein